MGKVVDGKTPVRFTHHPFQTVLTLVARRSKSQRRRPRPQRLPPETLRLVNLISKRLIVISVLHNANLNSTEKQIAAKKAKAAAKAAARDVETREPHQ